jgi:hypothetical protein
MTDRILSLLLGRRKSRPAPEDRNALREWRIAARIRELGDREREMNRWRRSYWLRTGRVA